MDRGDAGRRAIADPDPAFRDRQAAADERIGQDRACGEFGGRVSNRRCSRGPGDRPATSPRDG